MINPPVPSSIELMLFWYFMSINIVYSILLLLGAFNIYFRKKELDVEDFTQLLHSNTLPEITFVVPMYNEEKNIVQSTKSLLNLSYRYKQIIVVNDGSTDNCLSLLKKEYDLMPIPIFFEQTISTQPIQDVYRSRSYPELIVIDKLHAGKYDAVNAGVNACVNPRFIVIDADGFIDDRHFEAIIRPLLAYPQAAAIGSTVRIRNGSLLDYNRIDTKKISLRFIPIFQGMEYLRSFLQRQGWNYVGGNVVIAGAFSVLPTQWVKQTGGLSSSVAEDVEIIIRLHRWMRKRHKPYQVLCLPDPISWTEGPSTLSKLGRQRTRWHLGVLESIWIHKSIFFNPRYGIVGFFNYPFYIWGEAIEPVVEALGYVFIAVIWMSGLLNGAFAILLLLVSLGFTFAYSLFCLLIEELSFRKYPSLKTVLMMFFVSLVENLGYRQLTVVWRLRAFFRFFKKFKWLRAESKRINKIMNE